MSLYLIATIALLAGAVAAVSGFGIGSLLTPVLMLSMPTRHAVAVVAIPHAVATTLRWLRLRSDVHWPTFRQFGLASAIGGLGGAVLQPILGGPLLSLVLGLLLVLAGATELVERRLPLPPTAGWRLVGGAFSGFFGGLVGNQGGIRAAALLGFQLSPRELVATATASALLVDLARLPIYAATAGRLIVASAPAWAVASLGVVAGTLLGVPVLSRLPPRIYRRLVACLLLLLGIAVLVSAVRLSLQQTPLP